MTYLSPIHRTRRVPAGLAALALTFACSGDDTSSGSATSTATEGTTVATTASTTNATTAGTETGTATGTSTTGTSTSTTGVDPTTSAETTGTTTTTTTTTSTTDEPTTGDPTTGTTTGTTTDTTGEDTSTTGVVDLCKVSDDMDAVVPCVDEAPPDSFVPDIQWAWMGADGNTQVLVTPAVANLTDDNMDGAVDLCDIPDIVVAAYPSGAYLNFLGTLYVLDGATGAVHYSVPDVGAIVYPAIADIDADGVPEILTARVTDGSTMGKLMAVENDGTIKWLSESVVVVSSSAIGVADLDADGDPEIYINGSVFDHNGVLLWKAPGSGDAYVNTAADLDNDGDLELILGPRAYHHDGTEYYNNPYPASHPQVADLDDDGLPEVLLIAQSGLTILEHDGKPKIVNQVPNLARWQPAAIHDFDGDEAPEIAVGSGSLYSVLETNLSAKWSAPVKDGSGYASSTAFDFLGDGTAEAMYADETTLFIFDGAGKSLLTSMRGSWTQWENPIVVDVDNDSSAEIVVVSNSGYNQSQAAAVQVIRDKQERWIPARRIWNQHTYHVTNVREDGTIPQVEPQSWKNLNTFRTQAQVSLGGGVCQPIPQ